MPRVVKAVAGAKRTKKQISANGETEAVTTTLTSTMNGQSNGDEDAVKSGVVKGKARGRGVKRETPHQDELSGEEHEQKAGKLIARGRKQGTSEKSVTVATDANDKKSADKAQKVKTISKKHNEADETEKPEEITLSSKPATRKKVAKSAATSAGKGRGGKPKQAATEIDNGIDIKPIEKDIDIQPIQKAPAKKRATKKVAEAEENETNELNIEVLAKKSARGAKKKASVAKDKQTATKRKADKAQATVEEELQEPIPTPKKKAKQDVLPFEREEKPNPVAVKKAKGGVKSKKVDKKTTKENNAEMLNEKFEDPIVVEKKTRGRKRAAAPVAAPVINDDDEDDDASADEDVDGSKSAKAKKTKSNGKAAGPLNATATNYNKNDFALTPDANGQPRYNLKISSWNVAGLRSWLKKGGLRFLEFEEPDIFCMQETKCTTDQLPDEAARIPGYHPYWLCMPGGYAGVAIYSKIMPINVEYGIGNAEFDAVGRIITAEYEKFYLINVYVPNSGRKLVNLEPRMRWEQLFQDYVKKLDARKPLVICGDMNVSHQEIDLANPKTNTRNAGFTKEERDQMTTLLSLGYVDTFRQLYPDRKGAYTFWTYMGNARARNVGWRLDYFIVSQRLNKRVVENCMRTQVLGSDHCPITLFLKM